MNKTCYWVKRRLLSFGEALTRLRRDELVDQGNPHISSSTAHTHKRPTNNITVLVLAMETGESLVRGVFRGNPEFPQIHVRENPNFRWVVNPSRVNLHPSNIHIMCKSIIRAFQNRAHFLNPISIACFTHGWTNVCQPLCSGGSTSITSKATNDHHMLLAWSQLTILVWPFVKQWSQCIKS